MAALQAQVEERGQARQASKVLKAMEGQAMREGLDAEMKLIEVINHRMVLMGWGPPSQEMHHAQILCTHQTGIRTADVHFC